MARIKQTRKRIELSSKQKRKIIAQFNNGAAVNHIALENRIAKQTVRDIACLLTSGCSSKIRRRKYQPRLQRRRKLRLLALKRKKLSIKEDIKLENNDEYIDSDENLSNLAYYERSENANKKQMETQEAAETSQRELEEENEGQTIPDVICVSSSDDDPDKIKKSYQTRTRRNPIKVAKASSIQDDVDWVNVDDEHEDSEDCCVDTLKGTTTKKKRKRVVLSIAQKLEVIDKVSNGEDITNLSHEYNIAYQTIRDIYARRADLREFAAGQINNKKRKNMVMPIYAKLDNAMLNWYKKQQLEGIPLYYTDCVKFANQLYFDFGLHRKPKATRRWFEKFMKKNDIQKDSKEEITISSGNNLIHTENINDDQAAPEDDDFMSAPDLSNIKMTRKRVELNIEQKLKIVEQFTKGIRVNQIALENGIGKQTVRDILKIRDELKAVASSPDFHYAQKRRKYQPRLGKINSTKKSKPTAKRSPEKLKIAIKRENNEGNEHNLVEGDAIVLSMESNNTVNDEKSKIHNISTPQVEDESYDLNENSTDIFTLNAIKKRKFSPEEKAILQNNSSSEQDGNTFVNEEQVHFKKRKRVVLSIEKKLELIDRIDDGEDVKLLANEFGIAVQTARDLWVRKDELREFASHLPDAPSRMRKTMKKHTYEKLDKPMFCWYNEQLENGKPPTVTDCAKHAKKLFSEMKMKGEFKAGVWFKRFMKRYRIKNRMMAKFRNIDEKDILNDDFDDIEESVDGVDGDEATVRKKRKRVVLTIDEKLEVLEQLGNGASIKQVAMENGISIQTVRDFIRRQTEFQSFIPKTSTPIKCVKKYTYADLDKKVYEWYERQRKENKPLSSAMFFAQARYLFSKMRISGNFKASNSWLTRFKQRHNIQDYARYASIQDKPTEKPSLKLDNNEENNTELQICSDENQAAMIEGQELLSEPNLELQTTNDLQPCTNICIQYVDADGQEVREDIALVFSTGENDVAEEQHKPKRVRLTIDQKLALIKRVERGESISELAYEHGIAFTTVREIVQKKKALLKFANTPMKSRKTMKTSHFRELDEAMIAWYRQQQAKGVRLTGAVCAKQAKALFVSMGLKGQFNATAGWFLRFQQRHGLRKYSVESNVCQDDDEDVIVQNDNLPTNSQIKVENPLSDTTKVNRSLNEDGDNENKTCIQVQYVNSEGQPVSTDIPIIMPSEHTSTGKRKRIVLSIETKLAIIEQLENGASVKAMAAKYGLGMQTVRDWVQKKDELLRFAPTVSKCLTPRKTMRGANYAELDKAMIEWYHQQQARGVRVSPAMCMKQANELFASLGLKGKFNASIGWFTRFKYRHGLQNDNKEDLSVYVDDTYNALLAKDINIEELPIVLEVVDETQMGAFQKCRKMKRVRLNIDDKLEIIELVDAGLKVNEIATRKGIGKQTVRDIIIKRDEIQAFAETHTKNRKSMKKSNYEKLDTVMLEWFNEQLAQGILVTNALCSKQAQEFFTEFGFEGTFKLKRWLPRLKHLCDMQRKPESPEEDICEDEQQAMVENIGDISSIDYIISEENCEQEQDETEIGQTVDDITPDEYFITEDNGEHDPDESELEPNVDTIATHDYFMSDETCDPKQGGIEIKHSVDDIAAEEYFILEENCDEKQEQKVIVQQIDANASCSNEDSESSLRLSHGKIASYLDSIITYMEGQQDVRISDKRMLKRLFNKTRRKDIAANNSRES